MTRPPGVATVLVVVLTLVLSLSVLVGCDGEKSSSGTSAASAQTFTRDNWAELAVDPDSFEGTRVDIVGGVLGQPVKDGDETYWQMWPHPTNIDWLAVVGFEDPFFTIADGDYVHVVGTVQGKTEGEIPLLATLDAVAVRAETAEIVDKSALGPPALRTVKVAKRADQHGLTITLDKVEFSAKETRVFVTVTNQSTTIANFNAYKTVASQGQTLYEPEDFTYYEPVQYELPPDATSSGVVLFGAMDPTQATELHLDARTTDYQLEFSPYVFEVGAE